MSDFIATNNWLGLITYTTITIIISFVTYFMSRNKDIRNNKNRFRQEWIDKSRDALSEYCSLIDKLTEVHKVIYEFKDGASKSDFIKLLDFHYYKLILLFNSDSENNNHKLIREKLKIIADMFRGDNSIEIKRQQIQLELEIVVTTARIDLLNEWQKVKRGD